NCQASNKRKSLMRKHGAFSFICCLSVSYALSRTNPSGTDLHSAKCCPKGDGQEARHTTARHYKEPQSKGWGSLLFEKRKPKKNRRWKSSG
ncbi:MAG: hypothetical protein RR962_13390, partial [Hafnia sp.]